MTKTIALTLSMLAAAILPAFAHTGVSEQHGGMLHDIQHLFMQHDGTMSAGMVLAFLAAVMVGVGLALLHERSKS